MGSAYIQYIFNPKVHRDLQGRPTTIVGNASDTVGEYTLLRVDISCLRSFAVIDKRSAFNKEYNLGEDIPSSFLSRTAWKDVTVPIAATLLPNFFPIYFGQKLVHGDLRREDVLRQFEAMGTGYDLWADAAFHVVQNLNDINEVLQAFAGDDGEPGEEFDANIRKYLDPAWDPSKSVPLALHNGPCGTFDLVQSGDYHQEAQAIAEVFNPVQSIPQAIVQPQTVTVAIQGEVDKEAEAKKGITKLLLLHICADIDLETGAITNLTQATPSKGMECVLAITRPARAQAYADLLRKTCALASSIDPLHIRSTHMTMKVVQKPVASNLIGGNFATEPSSSLFNEANSIDPSIFMPQKNLARVELIKQSELALSNETMMDVPDAQKSKPKTAMARIGVLTNVDDFTSICVNMDTMISGTVDDAAGGPKPFLRQLLLDFITTVNGPEWKRWMEMTRAEMPNIHMTLYGYLESIWIGVATFATNFNNCNVIGENRPLTDLHLNGLKLALRSYKAFKDAVLNAQASNVPITQVPLHLRVAPSDSPDTSSNNNRGRENNARSSRENGRSVASGNQRARDGNSPPASSNGSPSSEQASNQAGSANKQARRTGSRFDTAAPTNSDRGMFYLRNTSINPADIFPADLTPKICPFFTCKGKECNKEADQCPGQHPTKASDIAPCIIAKIGRHFIEKNVGWFNEWHFARVDLAPELKALCGNTTSRPSIDLSLASDFLSSC